MFRLIVYFIDFLFDGVAWFAEDSSELVRSAEPS